MPAAKLQMPSVTSIASRIGSLDWNGIRHSLHETGWARTEKILTPQECQDLRDLYADPGQFRTKVVMARHRFGEGEYKYFHYPLPAAVQELRECLYSQLVPVANAWNSSLGAAPQYPPTHAEFIRQCHAQGQNRATPLLLRYESGGYNCLHQDLYGAVYFPLQAVFQLSRPEHDFSGGEFVLVEQRPRAQSAAQVISPQQGEAVIFTTRWRPVQGTRGHYRVNMKHGVSAISSGVRQTLGIVFHDAE